MMQSLIAIATFVVLAGGVVFGISRYRNPIKSEQDTDLISPSQEPIALPQSTETMPVEEANPMPTSGFKAVAIADPWDESTY